MTNKVHIHEAHMPGTEATVPPADEARHGKSDGITQQGLGAVHPREPTPAASPPSEPPVQPPGADATPTPPVPAHDTVKETRPNGTVSGASKSPTDHGAEPVPDDPSPTPAAPKEEAAIETVAQTRALIAQLRTCSSAEDGLGAATLDQAFNLVLADLWRDLDLHPYDLQELLWDLHEVAADRYEAWVNQHLVRRAVIFELMRSADPAELPLLDRYVHLLRPMLARQWDVHTPADFVLLDTALAGLAQFYSLSARSNALHRDLPLTGEHLLQRTRIDKALAGCLRSFESARQRMANGLLLPQGGFGPGREQGGASLDAEAREPVEPGLCLWQKRPRLRELKPQHCLTIRLRELIAAGLGQASTAWTHRLQWTDAEQRLLATVRVAEDRSQVSTALCLRYAVQTDEGRRTLDIPVGLLPATRGGGLAMACPHCRAPTSELHAPPGATGFACAACLGLSRERSR